MKYVATHLLHLHEPVKSSPEWLEVQKQLQAAIAAIVWPPGSTHFTINPTKTGNGVPVIKEAFVDSLVLNGWESEQLLVDNIGAFDLAKRTSIGTFGVEWETGNISSSHRSLNRLSLGLITNEIVGGILVVPTRKLYPYLTDRIGNEQELLPYFPLYKALPLRDCVLAIITVEHDAEDTSVDLIRKGIDGNSLLRRNKLNS